MDTLFVMLAENVLFSTEDKIGYFEYVESTVWRFRIPVVSNRSITKQVGSDASRYIWSGYLMIYCAAEILKTPSKTMWALHNCSVLNGNWPYHIVLFACWIFMITRQLTKEVILMINRPLKTASMAEWVLNNRSTALNLGYWGRNYLSRI